MVEARLVEEAEQRKKISHDLVAESIIRELASSTFLARPGLPPLSNVIYTDPTLLADAEDAKEVLPDVDDTDGLDPAGEFEAWKLRELMRIKRDKEAAYA